MKYKNKPDDALQLMNWESAEVTGFTRQYFLLAGMLLLFLLVYLLRMWHLQVLQGAKYRYHSENNRVRLEDIPAPRGIIYDKNGVPLVENRPAYHLQIIREDVQDMDHTIKEVAAVCEKSPEDLFATLEANKQVPKFVPLKLIPDIDRECLARIEAKRIRLPGVFVQLEPKREYRWNQRAAHLVGYLSEITESELKGETYRGYFAGEDIGRVGVEAAFEKFLHGKRGGRQVEVDAIGRRMRMLDEVLPIPGRNLWLTVDIELQRVAESCLEGHTGAVVAMDPKSGAVLAMATSPTFDQEKFIRGLKKEEWLKLSKDPRHPLLNRCVGAAYPPGSTFKPFVALGALKEGLITPDTPINCPGYLEFGNRRFRCWREHGHGSVDLLRSLIQSCDVYYYNLGMRLGVDRIAQYSNMFGLGEKTGVGLAGEHGGLIPTSWWKKQTIGVPWHRGETLSVAIGQGFDLATPLQMTLAFATIGNGGKLWQPFVVRRIEGNSVEEMSEMKGRLKRKVPIDQRYFDIVQRGLLGVVEDPRGTAHGIKDKSYATAGKTGTAQVVHLGENTNRKLLQKTARFDHRDHAWFVGYAPANDPQIAVGVLVEHGGHGSSAAAPLVQKVISAYLKGETGEVATLGTGAR